MLEKLKATFESAKENLGFIAICLGVFAGLFLIAFLFERLFVKNRRRFSDTRYITYVALFSAMAGVLMLLEVPLFFAPSFYKMDLSELPVMICTFYLGPVAGVVSELLKVLLKLVLKGTSTAFVGDFANFAVGCAFVLPATMVYHIKRGKRSALLGLVTGTVIMTVFGSMFNALFLIPKFAQLFHMDLSAIVAMGTSVNKSIVDIKTLVLYAVVPFNLLKGAVVSLLTFLLYKRVTPLLHIGDGRKSARKKKENAETAEASAE